MYPTGPRWSARGPSSPHDFADAAVTARHNGPVIIASRFNGPPGSGNGGYSAGVFADGAGNVEVTLRRPPPLDTPFTRLGAEVRAPDGTVVAEVAPAAPVDVVVPPVGNGEAAVAARRFAGFADHPFPTCFVCGPRRDDGLDIFPGRLEDGRTAAPWTVPDEVSVPLVWAALDCPGGWSVLSAGRPYVLGRLAVDVARLPEPGARCVVVGAMASTEGRKALVHSTLYGPDGAELARARATWIAI
jgi:hypothetical protein